MMVSRIILFLLLFNKKTNPADDPLPRLSLVEWTTVVPRKATPESGLSSTFLVPTDNFNREVQRGSSLELEVTYIWKVRI
jgi:hypothetical protein